MKFLEVVVIHLPSFKFDHKPLLVKMESRNSSHHRRPFRFLASWITHSDFNRFVRSHWNLSLSRNDSINFVQKDLEVWNKEVFGNIFSKNRKLLRKMDWINKSIANGRC